MTKQFFDETTDQSMVKATIVAKYFGAWAKVIMPTVKDRRGKLAYIDLFAGPGRYKDGAASTPLRILKQAIDDPDLRRYLATIFNDKDEDNARSLEKAINDLPGVDNLNFKPSVMNEEVGSEVVKLFEEMRFVPTLFFVDPWGYKGLSLQLVNAVVKDWACECIFFFNYRRINMGLNNPVVAKHMHALFGKERAASLRKRTKSMTPDDRELAVVEELCEALNPKGKRYVLPFRFKDQRGTRTSHHLIFISKHIRGYEIMKEIMARESSSSAQGVPSFEYSPTDKRFPVLFELSRPLDDLGNLLLDAFRGKKLSMKEVYVQHNVGRPYIKRNYKQALLSLEESELIRADPSADERKKNTFADHVVVKFPTRGER